MMRLPGSQDVTAPLLEPLKRTAPEETAGADEANGPPKRRRRRKGGENLTWEHHEVSNHSGHGERGQMRGFLLGGVVLLGLLFGGLAVFMRDREGRVKPTAIPVAEVETAPKPSVTTGRSDEAVLAEAKPLVEKFLAATSVDELLPWVRHPEISGPRMADYYPDGKVEAAGLSRLNPTVQMTVSEDLRSITVVTESYDIKPLVVSVTPGAMKVDWESWVGWSSMSWEEFRKTRPTTPQEFRVILSAVEYYNFAFSDDRRWQAYRLESPDRENSIYGYAEKGSTMDQQLRPNLDVKTRPLMLSLKFPEGAVSGDQVEIVQFLTEGWVEQDPEP